VLTDHVSEVLLAPTSTAADNLKREGIAPERIHLVGDVMYDVALYYADKAKAESVVLDRLGIAPGEYILATIHRAENTDAPLRLDAIVGGLSRVAAQIPVVLPLHPRTRNALDARGSQPLGSPGLQVISPVSYLDMVMLERHARLVVTDSGGVQKEAYFHSVPCVTLRGETEWVELLSAGWNRLLPPSSAQAVYEGVRRALEAEPPARKEPFYGDGKASRRIVAVLVERFSR
jgi:UDP-GlcNAc3NAcA epimerase